jgi:NAD-dependent DNA ligase
MKTVTIHQRINLRSQLLAKSPMGNVKNAINDALGRINQSVKARRSLCFYAYNFYGRGPAALSLSPR